MCQLTSSRSRTQGSELLRGLSFLVCDSFECGLSAINVSRQFKMWGVLTSQSHTTGVGKGGTCSLPGNYQKYHCDYCGIQASYRRSQGGESTTQADESTDNAFELQLSTEGVDYYFLLLCVLYLAWVKEESNTWIQR